ncbi:MAG: hypothetical protein WCO51_10135, partial [bacterium]
PTPRPIRYILQLSVKRLEIQEPKELAIAVWQVGEDGVPKPASGAAIQLSLAPGVTGFAYAPPAGTGQVSCTVSLLPDKTPTPGKLMINASVGGSQISESVNLTAGQGYEMRFVE